MKSQIQIHGRRTFDRAPSSLPPRPAMSVQFHAPVRYENIRGRYHFSVQLEAPAIVWGKDGRCWAFLSDFDDRSVQLILDDCRQAVHDRRGASARIFCDGY